MYFSVLILPSYNQQGKINVKKKLNKYVLFKMIEKPFIVWIHMDYDWKQRTTCLKHVGILNCSQHLGSLK